MRLIGRRIIEPGLGSELWRERELRHYRFDCSSNAREESLKVSGHGENAVSANRQYTDRRQSAGKAGSKLGRWRRCSTPYEAPTRSIG